MSSASPVSSPARSAYAPQHPEVSDHLCAGLLPVSRDLGPYPQLMVQDPGLHGVTLLQLGPRLVPLLLLGAEQVAIAGRRGRPFRQLLVDPVRILPGRGVEISNSCGPR